MGQQFAEGTVFLCPNPFTESLTLHSNITMRYTLYNAVGAELLTGTAPSGQSITLPTAQLAAGLYTVRCWPQDGTISRTMKVVKVD